MNKSLLMKGCLGVLAVLVVIGIVMGYLGWQIVKNQSGNEAQLQQIEAAAKAPNTRKPQFDVEYVNRQTGEVWGFTMGESADEAWYHGNDMQDRQQYEMRASTGNRYDLYEEGSSSSPYTVYVYENTDSILVSTTSRSQVFVAK